MRITYFANAMILLESGSSRVLCDPWVTFDRRSDSGLYNFPELPMTRAEVAALNPDFIYISHTHKDHFDRITLSLFQKSTPILIARFADNFTYRSVESLGFADIRVADPAGGLALNGDDRCWIEPNGTYGEVDSIFTARLGGELVVNLNDNVFDPVQCRSLKERFGQIDLACVPFSYQGPYPAFYENLTPEERATEAQKKRERNYRVMVDFAAALRPKRLFPFAAGALYGGPRARLYPYYGVGTCSEAVAFARHRVEFEPILLSQRCSYDSATGTVSGEYREIGYADQIDYIDAIAATPSLYDPGGLFWIAESERIDLTRLFEQARRRQMEWQRRRNYTSTAVYYVDTGQGPLYRFELANESVTRRRESEIDDPVYEIFRVPYGLMVGLLTRHYNWSNVKTQHIGFFRAPNVFNPDLHILMSYLQV